MATLVVDISDDLMQQIVSKTGRNGKAIAALVRRALKEYLETFDGTNSCMGKE